VDHPRAILAPRSKLILYNHEWCGDPGIRRMWLWDGHRHLRLRPEGDGRSRKDWTCHEMWERDGSAIIYHGGFANGQSYIGRVKPDGSGLVEIGLPKGLESLRALHRWPAWLARHRRLLCKARGPGEVRRRMD